jgi:hypothetical protein
MIMRDGVDHRLGVPELFGGIKIFIASFSPGGVYFIVIVWIVDMELPWVDTDYGS